MALNEGLRCEKRDCVGGTATGATGVVSFGRAMGKQGATARPAGVAGPTDADDSRVTHGLAIEGEVEKFPAAQRLQTHPGVGALTALAFVLIIGRADRFQCGKQIASYLGLVPLEDSSGQRRRLGHYETRELAVAFPASGSGASYVRSDQEWRSKYFHLAMRRGRKIAKVAMARRLAVRMYWMWRKGWDYKQLN